jgi:hypothetical protein
VCALSPGRTPRSAPEIHYRFERKLVSVMYFIGLISFPFCKESITTSISREARVIVCKLPLEPWIANVLGKKGAGPACHQRRITSGVGQREHQVPPGFRGKAGRHCRPAPNGYMS